jgi:hypothetical protein
MKTAVISAAIIFAASFVLAAGAFGIGAAFDPGDHDPLMGLIGVALNLGLVGVLIGVPLALLIARHAIRLLGRKLRKIKTSHCDFQTRPVGLGNRPVPDSR